MNDTPCTWRRRWPAPQPAYAAAVYANEATSWERPVVARHCRTCDHWHLFVARPSDAEAVARMRERGIPHTTLITEWTCQDDYGWEIVVAAYLTRCRHCGRLFSGLVSRRGIRAELPLYCSPTHSRKAQEARKAARERTGARRLAQ